MSITFQTTMYNAHTHIHILLHSINKLLFMTNKQLNIKNNYNKKQQHVRSHEEPDADK